MKKNFISKLLLIIMVSAIDLNGYSEIAKAANTNLVEKESVNDLRIISFTSDKKSPQVVGTEVTLKAEAAGEGMLQYKFIMRNSNGNWYKLRDYSTSNTCLWKPGAAGSKIIYVDVKDSKGNISRKEMQYVVKEKSAGILVTSFTADKQSPQVTGTEIKLTAKAAGEGTLQYKFLIRSSNGNWYKLRDYNTSNTCVWKPGAAGSKTLYVDVKDSKGNVLRKELSFVIKEANVVKESIPMEDTIAIKNITEPTKIYWNEDKKLASYKLEYVKIGDEIISTTEEEKSYITINQGTNIEKDGELGIFDTSLLKNGLYKVRLIGKDVDGNDIKICATYFISKDMKAGNISLSQEELNIPLSGIEISAIRNYDSKNNSCGDFGNGWNLSLLDFKLDVTENIGSDGWYQQTVKSGFLYSYEIKESKEHKVTITSPTKEVEEFTMEVSPNSQRLEPIRYVDITFASKNNSGAQLRDLDEKQFTVLGGSTTEGTAVEFVDDFVDSFDPIRFEFTNKNGVKYILNKNTGVEKIICLNGDYVTVDKNSLIYTSSMNNIQKEMKITRDSQGKIVSISDFEGKIINYQYDTNGNLIKVTDVNGHETNYRYDSNNKLIGIKNFEEQIIPKCEYGDNGRITAYTDEYGVRTEFNMN